MEPVEPPFTDVHRAALNQAHLCRGRCVDAYARLDEAVALALGTMGDCGRVRALPIPTLFGGRLAALVEAVAEDGPFASEGKAVRKQLLSLKPLTDLRNIFVHGTGYVFVAPAGRWLWRWRFTPTGKPELESLFDNDEMERIARELSNGTRSLRDLLRNMTAMIAARDPEDVKE